MTGASISQGLCEFIIAYEDYEEVIRERRLERKRRKEKLLNKKTPNIGGKKFIEEDPDN